MSERALIPGAPFMEPASKRRRVHDDSIDSTPRYSSPDPDPDTLHVPNLSIRRGRPSGRSAAVSRSPRLDEGEGAREGHDPKPKRYRSSTPPSSRGSRSRSRSRSRIRSRSRTRSPSYSHSRSRSRSPRSGRSRSQSRSRSRSRSRSSSSSRSRSRTSSSSRRSSQRLSRSGSQPPPPAERQPLRPRYCRRLSLRGHAAAISQVRISPDGRWIASASADGTVKIWDAETGEHLDTLVGHMAGVSCVAWAPDSNTLATGSDDKAIRLWDRVTASPAHSSGGDGERALGGGRGGGRGGKSRPSSRGGRAGRGPLLGHHNYVYCLAFSPKGNILASGSYDEAVFLWDVRAGRLMRSLPAHSDPVSGIDFCRDGTLVVSCSTDGLIRVWDTSTGQCLRTLVHEDNPAVTNVCFSPNGRFVLAFSLDSSIRLWDYVAGVVKKTYQGHKNKGFSIGGCFSLIEEADGDGEHDIETGGGSVRRTQAFIASASEDGDIVLWDVGTKQIVQRIGGAHKGVCFWVDANGRTMVSAGQDGMITVFRDMNRLPAAGNGTNGGGANGVNGLNVHGGEIEGSITPDAAMADDELQRQIENDAGSPLQHVKEEQL